MVIRIETGRTDIHFTGQVPRVYRLAREKLGDHQRVWVDEAMTNQIRVECALHEVIFMLFDIVQASIVVLIVAACALRPVVSHVARKHHIFVILIVVVVVMVMVVQSRLLMMMLLMHPEHDVVSQKSLPLGPILRSVK